MVNLRISCTIAFFPVTPIINSAAVVCNDAGGANQILAMISAGHINVKSAYLRGPALKLSSGIISEDKYVSSVEHALQNASTVVTGTGWGDLEHLTRSLAMQQGIFSIAVLDHWINYAARFERRGKIILPDELWVVDEYAMEIARDIFPDVCIKLQKDYYAEQQISQIKPFENVVNNELLYLLEPFSSNWGLGELGEFQALRYFLMNLKKINLPDVARISLRLHPSDLPDKYIDFLSNAHPWPVTFDTGTLSEAISRSKWVAGCQTYALTLALRAGRIVYGTLPPWAPPCVLPHTGIIHIKDLEIS